MIDIFLPPVLLVIVLVMIHAWFGKGVLERGIIFTDLAIAQFAALGSAVSLGYFHSEYIYVFTLGFALFSAFLISLATRRNIHLEAFIGILYVFGASGIMMVLANSAEGMEHFKALLATDILFTPIEHVIYSSLIYLTLGILIWKVYPRLQGFLKELMFFTMLAVTVTSSVQLAGVLVVFVLLVAPALVASMQKRFDPMLSAFVYGWAFALSAITVSYLLDLPTGYSIVFIGSLATIFAIMLLSGNSSSSIDEMSKSLPGSEGEHQMQEHFDTRDKAEDFYGRQMLSYLAPSMQAFIASQEMVFIATADKNGECDSSFRSGEAGFITVIDEKRVVYADYKGNGVLASVGNISENPHIGMLFVDFFSDKVGLHVNGKASVLDEKSLLSLLEASSFDKARASYLSSKNKTVFWVLVEVEEAYIHCSKNIPILKKETDAREIKKERPVDYFRLQELS